MDQWVLGHSKPANIGSHISKNNNHSDI